MNRKIEVLSIISILFCLAFSVPSTVAAGTTQYQYDDLHRLTRVERSDGTVTVYEYDDLGNRTRMLVTSNSNTTALFTASPTSGVYPLTVDFTDQSMGDITSWSWDFGDDQTSTEQNPSHTYNAPGSYTVTLTVTGPGGSDTETKPDYIRVEDETVWEKTYGGSGNERGSAVQQTADGGYIVAGAFDGTDIYLIKTDANGDQTWSNTFQGSDYGVPRSLQQTTDGGYIMAGDISTGCSATYGVYLIKADAEGNEEWRKTFVGNMYGASAQQTADGGYIIAGTIWYSSSYDVLLIKTDGSGDQIWSQIFHESAYKIARCVRQTSEGGYIVAGYTASYPSDVFLIKTDATGNEIWSTSFGGSDSDAPNSVKQTADGGYVIVGNTLSFGAGGYDVYLFKTDVDGNEVWSRTFGGSNWDFGYSVDQTSDGGYIVAGSTQSFGAGSSDVYLVKTDADGNEVWSRTFGGSEADSAGSVQQASDGGYISAGTTQSFGAGGSDVYLLYYKPIETLIAAFSAEPSSGIAPLTVCFTDRSTGNIASWVWYFGDGHASTEHNPTHIYDTPGIYTVSLTVSDTGGSDTEIKTDYILVENVEGFENGDLSQFSWTTSGDGLWGVTNTNPYNGAYAAESPSVGDSESAAIETTLYCQEEEISFWLSVSSEKNADYLYFYVDDELEGAWSGSVAYTRANYPVSSGIHSFKWAYAKDGSGSGGSDATWIDDICFPGSLDSDSDGMLDGWEIKHFGNMDHDGTEDTDWDDLTDLQEYENDTDPNAADTDSDGMPDGWEVVNNLDPLVNDALEDADEDGFCNWRECLAGTDPRDSGDTPPTATIYVDDDNTSGVEDGSESNPFNTIQEGVDFAGPGDTISVSAGNYVENVLMDRDIFLVGEDPGITIIDGIDAILPAIRCVSMTDGGIEGFHIQNGTGAGIQCEQSILSIQKNVISNTINGDGIQVVGGSSSTIENNVIYENDLNGIGFEVATATIVNNTIASNGVDGISCSSGDGVVIKNNIIVSNVEYGIFCDLAPEPQISYNNVWYNTVGDYFGCSTGTGDISDDPMFEDLVVYDFHILSGSPCIDAGTSDGAPEFDFEVNSRYDDPDTEPNTGAGIYTYYDIGAFEYLRLCESDFDNDGDVDGSDLAVFAADFDGDIDGSDLAVFAADFGRTDCTGPCLYMIQGSCINCNTECTDVFPSDIPAIVQCAAWQDANCP